MKKKLIALLLSVSVPIFFKPPIATQAYVNNGFINYSFTKFYSYIDTYHKDFIINLLFNKPKNSVLSSNDELHEFFTIQSRYIIFNNNIIAKNILLNNGYTLDSLVLNNHTYNIEDTTIIDTNTVESKNSITASITNSTYDTYTVTVKNLPSNTAKVRFPTWTAESNQEDLKWNIITVPSGTTSYSFTINRADYNFNNTHFVTDVYVEFSNGTMTPIKRLEHGFSKLYTKITSSNSTSYTVTAYNIPSKISAIEFPTWTLSDDQDDIKWYKATDNGNGTHTYTIQRSSHNNEKGLYTTHTYAVLNGNKIGIATHVTHDFNVSLNVTSLNIVGESSVGTYKPDTTGKTIMVQGNPKTNNGEVILNYYASMDSYEKGYRADSNYFLVYDAATKTLVDKIQFKYDRKELTAWNTHSILLNSNKVNVQESWLARYPNKDDITEKSSLIQARLSFGGKDAKYLLVPYTEVYMDDLFNDSSVLYRQSNASDYTKGITIVVDSTKPVLRFKNENTDWMNVPSYTLQWEASDALSGLKNIGYQIEGSDWKQFLSNPEDIIITQEGKTAASIKAMDNVGNQVVLNTFVAIDRTAPSISGYADVGWVKNNLNMNISATDSVSGVKSMELSVEDSSTVLTTTDTSNLTYTYGEEGITNFIVTATDHAGNTTSENFTYKIDKTAPDVEFVKEIYSDGTPILDLIVSDELSGVKTWHVRYNKNSTGWVNMSDNVDKIPLNEGDSYIFEVTAYDNAGNSASYTYKVTGMRPPNASLVEISGYNYKESKSIYWIKQNDLGALQIKTKAYYPSTLGIYPTETQVALATSKYSKGETSVSSASTSGMLASGSEFPKNFTLNSTSELAVESEINSQNTLSATHKLTTLLDNKNYHVYVGGIYQNVQSKFLDTGILVKTDGTAPKIINTSIIPTGWTNQNVTVSFNSTDNRSGIQSNQIKYTGANSTPNEVVLNNTNTHTFTESDIYNVTLVSTDNVGNESIKTTSFSIDKIAPVINNIPANNSIYGGKATLNLNATDSGGSGMKSLTLYKNNVSIVTGPNALSYIENDVGAHTYKVVALDNAGNTTEKTFTLTVVKKPNIDSLSVVKSDYKESNSVYWVRPNVNGVLQIKTQASFPSSYGIYPTETQLGLGKPNYTNGVSSLAWATTSRTGSSGSEFASNFTLNNGINKANTSSTNNKNILTFTHTLTPKLDNTNYTLYSSGKYNNEQANFVNSNIIIKTDGTAPTMTITSPIPTGWTNKDVMISFTSSDNRSGVKTNQIKYTGKNTAPNEVTLDNRNRITFTNTDKYSVTLLSIDKVGNISKTSGSFGIDKINPVIGTTPSNGTKYLDMTTLNITSTDAGGSLMKSLTLYRNNIKVKEGVDSVSYFENINGTHTFKVVAKDNAGNVSEREFTITILEDKINLITTPNNPTNLIRLEWSHQNLLNKSYTVYQKRDDASMFNVVPGTGDKFTQRVFDNKYASDVTPPNIPNVSFIEETDTDVKYTILPTEDNGTTYKFYVVSKDNHGKLTQSNTATDTVKTGVKGYAYIVDGKTTTIPNKQVNVTVDVSKIVAPIQGNFDHYLHIAAIDNAGNMGPVNHILIWEAVKNNWFNQEIAKQVRKDYSNLRISDYRRIETIALRNKNISGEIPKDIKKTINLVELDLYRNSINDISNLKNLTKLEYLDLGNNRISDISTLTGLTELTDLNIYNNNVSDISVVAHMPNLERLYIHKNNITDISVVEQLNYLEEFYFEFNYINLTDPTTIRIIEKFENQGCYVVSAPQNIVRANDKDIVELNIGDEFIPTTILGLSENNIDIIGEHSILRALDINYLSSDTNIVDIQNNKLIALSEGEATITVVHKQFRNIATVSFTIKVIDPNKELDENIEDLEDVIIDNDGDNIIDDNITNDDNVVEDNLTDDNSTSEGNKPSINESESNNNTEPNKDNDTDKDNNTDTEKIEEEVNDSTQNNANNTNNSNEEVSMIEQLE